MHSLFWSFLEQGSSKLVAIIVQVVLARLLMPEAFGLLALLLVVTTIADSIAQSGFGMALIQKTDTTDASYDTAFWMSMGIATVLYVIIFALAPVLADFYSMPRLAEALRVLSLTVFFNSANSIQRSYMQKRMNFKGLFRIGLVSVVCSGSIGIGAAIAGAGVWALVAQALSQSVLTCIAMAFIVPWRPHARFRRSEAAELYGFGWKICITGILNVFYTGISELILGKACSASELGFYSQGRKYPNSAIGVVTGAICNVLFPALSDVRDDKDKLCGRIRRCLALGTFVVAPTSLLFAAVAEPLVGILLGESWLPCFPIFALTCAGNAFSMFQLVNLRAYMALGRSDLYMWLQIAKVTLGVVVIGGAALITHDIYFTAWVTFIVGVLSIVVIDMAPAGSMHGYTRAAQLRDMAPTLAVAMLAYLAAMLVPLLGGGELFNLLLQSVVFIALYLIAARLLRIPAFDDARDRLRSFSKKAPNKQA